MSEIGKKSNPSFPPLPTIKVTTSPASPQIPRISRQPHIARTNSQSKPPRKTSTEKNFKTQQIEKELKFSRHLPEGHLESSFVSENNLPSFFAPALEESTETIQKVKSYSREKQMKGSLKVEHPSKGFDVLSGISGSNLRRGEEYYAYWKAKAHQYLESNMKLMGDIRRLNYQNETLKQQLSKLKRTDPAEEPLTLRPQIRIEESPPKDRSARGAESDSEVRKMSLYYLSKIEEMEKELKKKEIIIGQYQQKISELGHRVAGDNERIRLMGRMRQELQKLQEVRAKQEVIFVQESSLATLQMNSPSKKVQLPPGTRQLGSYKDLPSSHQFSQMTQKNNLTPRKY